MTDIHKLLVQPTDTIRQAMAVITEATKAGLPSGIAIAASSDRKLLGVITDGDIRRALLNGNELSAKVESIMIKDPVTFLSGTTDREILRQMPEKIREKKRYRTGIIQKIIYVDKENRVERVQDFLELWRNHSPIHRQVSVIGCGYVGLTLATMLAEVGFQVTGVEARKETRDTLLSGEPHFHEAGLRQLFQHHLGTSLMIRESVPESSEIYIISVGTPIDKNLKPSLDDLSAAAQQVGKVLKSGDLVILRSTVPVGTCRNHVLPLLETHSGLKCGRDFYLSFAPERTAEGRALVELRSLPQIIGGYDQNSTDMTSHLFRELSSSVVTMSSLEAAEMVKLVNNSFRDLKFAFANELALICESFNLNTAEVVESANHGYPRDPVPLPSPGVGGICLKKDPYIFAEAGLQAGYPRTLSYHGRSINERIPSHLSKRVTDQLTKMGKSLSSAKIFILGFAFKGEPETSDMRHSVSLDFLESIRSQVGEIRGYDPVVPLEELKTLGIKICSLEEGFRDADCAILMNNHQSFRKIDLHSALRSMAKPGLYCDFWNLFPPRQFRREEGITYLGLGFTA